MLQLTQRAWRSTNGEFENRDVANRHSLANVSPCFSQNAARQCSRQWFFAVAHLRHGRMSHETASMRNGSRADDQLSLAVDGADGEALC